jgi:hypothetical protein
MGPEKVEELVSGVRKHGCLPDGSRACLLCEDTCPGEPMFVGVFIADRESQRRIGCPPEKLVNGGGRVIIYQLCPSCYESPTRNEDVEAEILRRMSVQ